MTPGIPLLRHSRRAGARLSLRHQLLVALVALSLPSLLVVPIGGFVLKSGDGDHASDARRVAVAAELSDLQTRVAALTGSLTVHRLLTGDPQALLNLLLATKAVEQGFDGLRPRVGGRERVAVDHAGVLWQALVGTIAGLPPRFPELRHDADHFSLVVNDVGSRLLDLAQVLNQAAASNAGTLSTELDAAHDRQRTELATLVALALLGLLTAVWLARLLHRRITSPLLRLQDAAQRLGDDGLEDRVVPDRTPELGALAVAFNAMADRLQDSRALLVAREQRFRALVQHSNDIVAVLDPNLTVTYLTPSAQALLGVPAAQLQGTRLLDRVHPRDRELVAAVLDTAMLTPAAGDSVSCRFRSGAGSDSWCDVELVVNNLLAEPAVAGLVVTARDVSEQTRLHEQLRHQALHDELTGLANRLLFTDRLTHALAGRDVQPPALLYCDLDGFKAVNDTLGHAAGDALLVEVGRRLTAHLRPRDTAARLGGDEFAVLLNSVTAGQALEAAQRLHAAVSTPVLLDGVEVPVHVSIGVASGCAPGAHDAEELLRQADAAMYQAKQRRAGNPQDVVLYDADLAGHLLARLELTSDLHGALHKDQFRLVYQPTVELSSGRITGVEALVRWDHPGRGVVSPVEFIPLAEETSLIVALGLWILETACAQMVHWQHDHPEHSLHLNVNLSGRQLEHPGIVSDVAGVLSVTGLDPAALTLELTESVLLDRSEHILQRLHALKALGVQLAIDDFGTGYSSLSYLQRLPIDVLKIDKSFVDALTGPAGTADALAATIVSLANTLGLDSVAEGIEHPRQADALRELGCRHGQGYLYARPLTPARLEDLLHAQTPPGTRNTPGAQPPPARQPRPGRRSALSVRP